MKLIKQFFLVITLILCPAAMLGQNYSYMELSPSNGFPSKINTIFVEQDGFAWLGSDDGLYLIYANNYFSFHNPEEGYLASSNVTEIYCDDTGMAWILTDAGFYGYNSRVHLEHPQVILGLDGHTVATSVISKGDDVYFGGEDKVWKYSHSTGEFTVEVSLDGDTPFLIEQLHFGYGNGGNDLILMSNYSEGMFICNVATHECRPSNYAEKKDFISSFVDSKGVLWLSELGKGIFSLAADGSVLKRFNTSNSGINSDIILCFAEREGKLWLGTDGGGINILDPDTGKVTILSNDPRNPNSCPANMVSTMFCDKSGNVWCGRPSGGAFVVSQPLIKSFPNSFFNPPIDNKGICCFFENPNDNQIWIGTNGSGVIRYNPANGSFSMYPSTAGMHVHSIALLPDGNLVLSCPNTGLLVLDIKTGSVRMSKYEFEAKNYYYSSDRSASLCNDPFGNVILFTDRLARYYPSGAIEIFRTVDCGKGYLRPVTGSHGQYIIDDESLFRWEESAKCKLRRLYNFAGMGRVHAATFSEDGTIWLSIGPSIYRFDTKTNEVTELGNSFETEPKMIFSSGDHIWFGTRNRLYCYTPATEAMLLLGEIEGVFDNEYMPDACLESSQGDIYFGGRNGFIQVEHNFKVSPVRDPEIIVAAVVVDDVEVFDFGEYDVPYDHSQFDVRVLVRAQNILQNRLYHVKAEGRGLSMDEYLTVPVVHFRRLNPGRYTISISSTTSDGRWTEMKEVYSFKVKKPWYLSLGFLLACFLFVGIVYFQVSRYRAKVKDNLRAKQASEERYNFLINVAHELRTPLTLVQGPVKRMLKDKKLSDSQRTSLTRVFQQSTRISDLLNTVLTTNRIEEGVTKVNLASVEVNPWLENLSDDFRDEAAAHDMDIVMKLDPSVSAAMMDEGLCTVVFSNIMSNAIKHNQPKSHITVWSGWNRETGMIKIAVRDHGNGIGNVDVSKLFDHYYKATEEHTGFGIGLAYAKVIIDAHGGRIGAYNNDDEHGATFWFEIPADHDAIMTKEQVNRQVAERVEKIAEKALIDKCILYVDDNQDLRYYFMDEIAPMCRKLITASNGITAMKAIQNHDVDVVITDIMMPEMDGIALCKAIKFSDHFKHIKVIMLTAKTDNETVNLSHEVHADSYITKPFELDEIINAINQ